MSIFVVKEYRHQFTCGLHKKIERNRQNVMGLALFIAKNMYTYYNELVIGTVSKVP